MTTLRVQVALPNVNGLPADVITNTWHFSSDSVDPLVDAGSILTELQVFYDDIDALLAATIDTSGVAKVYNLEDPEPRVPILVEPTFVIAPGANAPLPHEVACVLSYNAILTSGSSLGRRRGRIFLGPLDSAVMDDSLGQSILQTSTCSTIANAAGNLRDAGSPSTWQWAVFSPTDAGAPPWSVGELLGATRPVIGGFVDNSFDTIRSRGIAATLRETF